MKIESKRTFCGFLVLSQVLNCFCIPIKDTGFQQGPNPSSETKIEPVKLRALKALANPIKMAYNKVRPALKVVGLFYIGYQMINLLLPTVIASLGSKRSFTPELHDQSLSDAVGELGVSAMVETWKSWSENGSLMAPDVLKTWENQCKSRATCELGRSLSGKLPYLFRIMGYVGARIPFLGKFGEALSLGINSPDCSELFPDCPYLRPNFDEL